MLFMLGLKLNNVNILVITETIKAAFIFSKNGPTLASLLFIFGLFKQTINFLQQINVNNVMSIQYKVPGFEPTTSWTWVVSHRPGLPFFNDAYFHLSHFSVFIPGDFNFDEERSKVGKRWPSKIEKTYKFYNFRNVLKWFNRTWLR